MSASTASVEVNKIIIPEYQPPKDLSPAEAGVLYDTKFGDREVTATIVDLAMRKFISINLVPEDEFADGNKVFEFTLLRDDDDLFDLLDHEQAILNGLFGVVSSRFTERVQKGLVDPVAKAQAERYRVGTKESMIGNTVRIDELKPYFYQYVRDAHNRIYQNLIAGGYITQSNPLIRTLLMIVGISGIIVLLIEIFHGPITRTFPELPLSAFDSNIAIGAGIIGSVLLSLGIALGVHDKRSGRTPHGKKAKQYIDGFLLYLRIAEADRLKGTQSPHTVEYSNSGAEIYRTYLPYAIALGLEKDWTSKFDPSYKEETKWISENDDGRSVLSASIAAALIIGRLLQGILEV